MLNPHVCSRSEESPTADHDAHRRETGAASHTTVTRGPDDIAGRHERRLDGLVDRLPDALQPSMRWLRRPSSRWARIPAGLLLVGGGMLFVLPFLGLWMLPLGLMVLAEDVPPLRRARGRLLDRVAHHRPHWFAEAAEADRGAAEPRTHLRRRLPGQIDRGGE